MKNKKTVVIAILLAIVMISSAILFADNGEASASIVVTIKRMDDLPNVATDYEFKDWKQTTIDYINYILDYDNKFDGINAKGESCEDNAIAIARDTTSKAMDAYFGTTGNTFWSVKSYVGVDENGGGEGICCIAAILSASQVGLDMTAYSYKQGVEPRNYVREMVAFYAAHNGENVVLNNNDGSTGASFWYNLLPGCLFNALYEYYPQETYLKDIIIESGKKWAECVDNFGGINCDFSQATGYLVRSQEPRNNGSWREPDAAAGIAYMLYGAYEVTKNDAENASLSNTFLTRALWCMDFLERLDYSPFYEVLTFLAPPIAAKMNVYNGKNYNIAKYINWTLDGSSAVRGGWGMINESWGGKHTYGLMGSLSDGSGYAFAMNTFDAAWGFLPTVKYDTRFAHSIGKWALNVSNSARYYYGAYHSGEGEWITDSVSGKTYKHWSGYYQSSNFFAPTDPEASFIPYEGLRKYQKGFHWNGSGGKNNFTDNNHSPYASGDSFTYNWGGNTDLGLYGGSHVGMFGASFFQTNVPQIIQVDLNALDYFAGESYPTYLYYNPYNTSKTLQYTKTSANARLYDATNKEFLATSGSGTDVTFNVPADTSLVIVELPANGEVVSNNGVYTCNGIYVTASRSSLSMSVSQQDGDNWKTVNNGDVISGTIKVDLSGQVDTATTLNNVTISFGSTKLYESATLPNAPIEIDTSALKSGKNALTAVMNLANGGLESQSVTVTVANSKLETAVSFDTAQALTDAFNSNVETWNASSHFKLLPFDCTVTTDNTSTKIACTDSLTYGSAFTPYYKVDLSRTPILEFNVDWSSASWAIKVFIDGGDNTGYYLIRDTDAKGPQTVNLMDCILQEDRAFDMSGVQDVAIWVLPTGTTSCYVTISNVRIYYLYDAPVVIEPNQYQWEYTFTPGYLNLWSSAPTDGGANYAEVSYLNSGYEMFATADGQPNGRVASPYIMADLSKNPVFKVTPKVLQGTYSIGVLYEGNTEPYVLASNISNVNEQVIPIMATMRELYPSDVRSGSCNMKIVIILDDQQTQLTLQNITTYYQLTVWGTTVTNQLFEDWVPNAIASNAGKITNTQNAYGDYRITNTDSSDATTTLRGASGKFELNLDRNPILEVSIAQTKGKWGISLVFFGDLSQRYDVIPTTTGSNTKKTVNVMDELLKIDPNFARKGTQSVYVQVNVIGGGNYVDVRKVATSYKSVDPNFEQGKALSGREITSWQIDESLKTLSYLNKQNTAVLQENLKGSSAITTSAVSVKLANNPFVIVDTESVTGAWRLFAVINGTEYDLSPKAGYTQAGQQQIDVASKLSSLDYNGTSMPKIAFRFVCEGADSTILLSSVRFAYKLQQIDKISVNGNVLSWNEIPFADFYKVIVYSSENVTIISEDNYTQTSYDVTGLSLPDGVYKIVVTPASTKAISPVETSQGFKQGDVQSIQLGTVNDVTYDGMFVRFDKVDNAQGYLLQLTDVDSQQTVIDEFTTVDNFLDMSSVGLPNFNYSVKIKVLGDDVAYLSSEYTTFDFATTTVARYTPKVLTTFTPVNNEAFATVTDKGTALLQLPTGGNWGEMGGPSFYLNMDDNPIWYIDFGTITHGYYMRMYVDGQLYYITDNVFSDATVWFDIVGILTERGEAPASALTGNHLVRFCFGVTGAVADVVNPTVEIVESRVFTMKDGYVEPIRGELATPVLSVGNGNVSWQQVEHATGYSVTVSNQFGVLYTTNTTDLQVDLSFLMQEDDYTVTVFASGDGYYDSDIGTIVYTVSDSGNLDNNATNIWIWWVVIGVVIVLAIFFLLFFLL